MPQYSTKKLEARIVEVFGTQQAFAQASGINESTLSRLLNRGNWKASQIEAAVLALKLRPEEIPSYFFEKELA